MEVGGHYFIVVLLAVIVVKELFALFYVTKDMSQHFINTSDLTRLSTTEIPK